MEGEESQEEEGASEKHSGGKRGEETQGLVKDIISKVPSEEFGMKVIRDGAAWNAIKCGKCWTY